jgi:hypothetical protein
MTKHTHMARQGPRAAAASLQLGSPDLRSIFPSPRPSTLDHILSPSYIHLTIQLSTAPYVLLLSFNFPNRAAGTGLSIYGGPSNRTPDR